ncbi:unnamed protein product [Urochloa humidicola]
MCSILDQDEAYASGMFMASVNRTGTEQWNDQSRPWRPCSLKFLRSVLTNGKISAIYYLAYQMVTPQLAQALPIADGQENEPLQYMLHRMQVTKGKISSEGLATWG